VLQAASLTLAERVVETAKALGTFEGLTMGAKRGCPIDVLPNFQKYLCGSHVIYFLNYTDRLDVVRILHQRQDAEQHL
jgi:toxin ParE1/3/4